jgi:ATP-dependent RNA helicase UAP56/SUB2
MAALVKDGLLNVSGVKHFVLDECDRLLAELDMRADMQSIFLKTPHDKQVMMFSATLPDDLKVLARRFMSKSVMELLLDDETKLVLHGLQQYHIKLDENAKTRKLIDILDNLQFNQIIIFVGKTPRAIELNKLLLECNFPAVCLFKGMNPKKRAEVYSNFKERKSVIMISTDILGRGVDVEGVNAVINFDFPRDTDGYIHRVNRAGRFGTKGLAISFISSPEDTESLKAVQARFGVAIGEAPEKLSIE